jgi:hypothetical protein
MFEWCCQGTTPYFFGSDALASPVPVVIHWALGEAEASLPIGLFTLNTFGSDALASPYPF